MTGRRLPIGASATFEGGCPRCGWPISAHLVGLYGLDCPVVIRRRAEREDAPRATEPAPTPTDDEREALIGLELASYSKRMADGYPALIMRTNEEAAEVVLAAGFRRSEVPEPSAASAVTEQGENRDEYECLQDRACAYGAHSVECEEANR